jgi:hypothetical protein
MIEQVKTYKVECDEQRYPFRGEGPRCLGTLEVQGPSKRDLLEALQEQGWEVGDGWHPRWDTRATCLTCPPCVAMRGDE